MVDTSALYIVRLAGQKVLNQAFKIGVGQVTQCLLQGWEVCPEACLFISLEDWRSGGQLETSSAPLLHKDGSRACGAAGDLLGTCLGKHRLMKDAWSSTLNRNAELQTSAFLKDSTLSGIF